MTSHIPSGTKTAGELSFYLYFYPREFSHQSYKLKDDNGKIFDLEGGAVAGYVTGAKDEAIRERREGKVFADTVELCGVNFFARLDH